LNVYVSFIIYSSALEIIAGKLAGLEANDVYLGVHDDEHVEKWWNSLYMHINVIRD
jgi:hypothetical protein